jgi:hypothetical protein
MRKYFPVLRSLVTATVLMFLTNIVNAQEKPEIAVRKTSDFNVTGDGKNDNWSKTAWIQLPVRGNEPLPLKTRIKLLYSGTGIYFLFDCQDKHLTSAMNADFLDLWKEDVVEVFLWTNEKEPFYFEYELSPLNYELPLLISNEKGELLRWMPFHYEPGRITGHATSVQGGEKKSNAAVSGWMAEIFIPYKLLSPLVNRIPEPGMKWRANMYRVDYDPGARMRWSWQPTEKSFHDYEKFGSLIFE